MSNENCFGMKTLSAEINLKVRFSETDAMGVVWHGNYLKFFEDAREHFGAIYGMEYLDVYKNGYFTPIVKSEINHKSVVDYGQEVQVIITLIFCAAAKIMFNYKVINTTTNQIAAVGQTIQVFMDAKERTLMLNKPEFYEQWENNLNWQ